MNICRTLVHNPLRQISGTAILPLIIVVIITSIASSVHAADSPALRSLKAQFTEESLYRAEMSHHFTDSFTGETTDVFGTIWFGRDAYRIDTPDQIVIVNGDVSTVWNRRQNRVIISHYSADDDEFAPSRFFTGDHGAFQSEDVAQPRGGTMIHIRSDDPFELFSEVRIFVDADGRPLRIEATDQMENKVRTEFRFGRFERLGADLFTPDVPDGTEIIDLRD
jgi:outer membrane lipoprotein-sorting protein